MICQKARDIFPELLDQRSRPQSESQSATIAEARSHLANCPDCQREFAALSQTAAALDAMPTPQPSPRLRKNFYAMLEEEKHSAASVRAVTEREFRARRASLWRWILAPAFALAIALIAFQAGMRVAPAVPAPSSDDAMRREIAKLRQEVTQTKQLVATTVFGQQQNPANDRLRDILAAAKEEKPSDKVIDTLISAVNIDPSANVRLRALEALFPHADNKNVRAGILAALQREQNPLVQLEMIDFVAASRDREATPALEQISQNESNDQSVREAARKALASL